MWTAPFEKSPVWLERQAWRRQPSPFVQIENDNKGQEKSSPDWMRSCRAARVYSVKWRFCTISMADTTLNMRIKLKGLITPHIVAKFGENRMTRSKFIVVQKFWTRFEPFKNECRPQKSEWLLLALNEIYWMPLSTCRYLSPRRRKGPKTLPRCA